MNRLTFGLLTLILAAFAWTAVTPANAEVGNLGYNSFESYLSGGTGQHRYFGPGVGYPSESGSYFRRYIPPESWGRYGYGTGHLGEGYGPYIFGPKEGASPPGLFDIPPPAYAGAPPPAVKVKHGFVFVTVPNWVPGIRSVTVTLLAYNGAELATQCISAPPYQFKFPVEDGVTNVRVRIDYPNNGLSATSYPL